MTDEQLITFGETLLAMQAVALTAAIALAVFAVLEARWWKRLALRNDPALADLDSNLPPFIDGLLDRYRKAMR